VSKPLAAVDIGSNTVHVLVACIEEGQDAPQLEDVGHYVEMPQLGAEVGRTGRVGPDKAKEVIGAVQEVLARAREHGYQRLVAGATAAVRRAADADWFLEEASRAIGTRVRLISEQREAELSFEGVASRHADPGPWMMADVGGGSTELVAARGSEIDRWVSLELGSGALARRFLSDPPLPGERDRLRQAALEQLGEAPDSHPRKLVATGGTAANLPPVVSPDLPAELTVAALESALRRLDAAPAAEVAASVGLAEARALALRGGVEILLLVLARYRLDRLSVSYEGLRHGMLMAYLARGEDWWR
jgi:exopolyphosphatase/guanosine-5'-triphosphate,3'-diphosphate pyrophosphatase